MLLDLVLLVAKGALPSVRLQLHPIVFDIGKTIGCSWRRTLGSVRVSFSTCSAVISFYVINQSCSALVHVVLVRTEQGCQICMRPRVPIHKERSFSRNLIENALSART